MGAIKNEPQIIQIVPQPGPQTLFHSTPADIAIYGGGAGGGKTYSLLMEPLRHYYNPEFQWVTFRREAVQLTNPGAIWDQSHAVYSPLRGTPREKPTLDWTFTGGLRVKFGHLSHENDKYAWQGSEVPGMGFDELTHFTETQFFYMLSRNRSRSGVSGYVRCTCNPDPDSWVANFINWWWDPETGYPIDDRSGNIRYFVRKDDAIMWADTREELIDKFGKDVMPKSVTFIPSTIYDNKALLEKDPGYLANLQSLCLVEREQLLKGNWKIRPAAGAYFKRGYFPTIDAVPLTVIARVRYWDRAATEPSPSNPNPDWTASVKLCKFDDGTYCVEDVMRDRLSPGKVETLIKNTAQQDGTECEQWSAQDPGSAGKYEAQNFVKMLSGFYVKTETITGDKITRAKPASAQAEAGNIKLLRGPWNKDFLSELEAFPGNGHDDQVDAFSGAFNVLATRRQSNPRISFL